MIQGFESHERSEPERKDHVQWGPAVGAGLIAGVILLVVPRGSPWSSFTFFTSAAMGRNLGMLGMSLGGAYIIHLALALLYGLLISRVVASLKWERALLTGGLLGLVLYIVNFGVVSTFWPQLRGSEISVVFTHIVFGLISAAAYRGLLKRKAVPAALPPASPG